MELVSLVDDTAATVMHATASEDVPMSHRILVIDHDDDTRMIVCDRLLRMGFDAVGEDNGVSGLARIAHESDDAPFTGVVLELDMPVLGGMAVLQELRDRYPAIPVIAMSHSILIDRLRQAVKLGAREYLVKPFDSRLFRTKCLRAFVNGSNVA
jgi:CheY-like chemotaxis protein